MKYTKLKKSICGALTALLVVCLAVVVGLNWNVFTANAADRSVTISGSTIFYTAEGAEVWSHEMTDADENSTYYTMFVLQNDDDAVKYRRNLAYEWKYNATENNSDSTASSVLRSADGYFSMEFGFEAADEDGRLGFEKYTLAFASQQFAATDDGVTTNYIMFVPTADNKLSVLVTDDPDAEVPEEGTDGAFIIDDTSDILITFSESEAKGAYVVNINNKAAGEFTNIGGTYSKYVSSTTDPVIPITFQAEFNGDAEESERQIAKLYLIEMNEQQFNLNSTPSTETDDYGETHFKSGKVNDNAAPVLCLDTNLNYMQLGGEIDFDYTVIDVLASSPSITTSYFMLTTEQAADTAFDASDYDGTYNGRNIYKTVTSSDKQYLIPHSDSYVPTTDDNEIFDGEDLTASALVKIAVKLTDTTATGGLSTYVFLDWYADESYIVSINGNDYIAVAEDSVGATYAYVNEDTETNDNGDGSTWEAICNEYQEMVTEAAAGLKAGSKNKFYLPDASSLFSDKCTAYEDLTFSIYYNNGSQQSSSSLSYNNLSITLSKSGEYVFTIYVTDADGNNMWYYNPDYKAGVSKEEDQKKEFETSEIWDMYTQEEDSDYEDTRQYLPWFRFTISDSELSIDDPGERDIAYLDTTYNSIDFDINGVEYSETYKLYYFDNDRFAEDTARDPSDPDYLDISDDEILKEAGYEAGDLITYDIIFNNAEHMYTTYREYFKTIVSTDEMEDNYSEYENYRDYAWSTSSLSFVPQEAGYYICTCTVESTGVTPNIPSVTAYMVITASEKPTAIHGEDTWVQDNVASIVLLCVAGAALIGIILLIVIKPKEKQDIDEIALVDSAAAKKEKAKQEKKNSKKKK